MKSRKRLNVTSGFGKNSGLKVGSCPKDALTLGSTLRAGRNSVYSRLAAKLKDTYPLLMHQRSTTSFTSYGIECGSGWYAIIHELLGLLDDVQQRTGKAVWISQIKQKYGTLRLYFQAPVESIEEDMLELVAEYFSSNVCDVCGEPGAINPADDWLAVRCDEHRQGIDFDKAKNQVSDKYLSYARQGLSTKDLVFVHARRSDADQEVCEMSIYHFPERLLSLLVAPLLDHLRVEHVCGSFSAMNAVFEDLDASKTVLGITDGSMVADAAFGREIWGMEVSEH